MKKVVPVLLIFIATAVFGQNISDYQWVKITTSDDKSAKYGLVDLLATKLKQKNYTILNEEDAIAIDPCDILTAEISDTSSMFRNRVQVDFRDCTSKTVASLEAKSMIKDFEPGMRDALQLVAAKISAANPVLRNQTKKSAENVTSAEKSAPEKILAKAETKIPEQTTAKAENTTGSAPEIFTNGNLTLNRIILSADQFILVNLTSSTPYATFKASSKKDVYHVQLENKTTTLGFFENGNLIIDMPISGGDFKKEVFRKK